MNSHTIVLIQFVHNENSKTFMEYDSIEQALDGVCQFFEQDCKYRHPDQRTLTYGLSDLLEYVDRVKDLCFMIADGRSEVYRPKGKHWIKDQLITRMSKQVKVV